MLPTVVSLLSSVLRQSRRNVIHRGHASDRVASRYGAGTDCGRVPVSPLDGNNRHADTIRIGRVNAPGDDTDYNA